MPDENPLTQLGEVAAQLHELYTTYVAAGFTEHQALYLIGQQVAAASGPAR